MASTINTSAPAASSPLASSVIRALAAAAANDINNILGMFSGPTAPGSPSMFQFWANTSSAPYPLNVYDGAQWVTIATINPTTHQVLYPPLASVQLAGSTSGAMTLAPPAVADSYVMTFPPATDTVATLAAVQTLSNKTLSGVGFSRHAVADANYTIVAGVQVVAYTSLTAPRAVALPVPTTVPAGQVLLLFDESGNCSSANTITLLGAGYTIDGAANLVLSSPYAFVAVESNGVGAWTVCSGPFLNGAAPGAAGGLARIVDLQVFDITAYGAKCDGTTDDTTALNAALAAASTAGGGTVRVPGMALINGAVVIPNAGGGGVPNQNAIRITGSAVQLGYGTTGGVPAGPGGLDLRFSGSPAKIYAFGKGTLEIDHLELKDGGSDSGIFIWTTNTTVFVHHCNVIGTASGYSAVNDFIVFGGNSASVDGTSNSAFGGYGSQVYQNKFANIRRVGIFQSSANGIIVNNNTVDNTCGSNLSHTISAATNANPVVLTDTGHGLTIGQTLPVVFAGGTGGWAALNGLQQVTVIGANTFSVAIDSTAFGALAGPLVYYVGAVFDFNGTLGTDGANVIASNLIECGTYAYLAHGIVGRGPILIDNLLFDCVLTGVLKSEAAYSTIGAVIRTGLGPTNTNSAAIVGPLIGSTNAVVIDAGGIGPCILNQVTAPATSLYTRGSAQINGTIGIGTVPSKNFQINNVTTIADPLAPWGGFNSTLVLSLTANNAQGATATQGNISTGANAFNITGILVGLAGTVGYGGSATLGRAYGSQGNIANTGGGIITNAFGHGSMLTNGAGSTASDFRGFYAATGSNLGTLTNWYGFYADSAPPGAVTAWAFYGKGVGFFNLNTASLAPARQVGTMIRAAQADGVVTRVELDSFAAGSVYSLLRSEGTMATPTALATASEIGALNWGGFDGTSWNTGWASVRAYGAPSGGTATNTDHGSRVRIATTPAGSVTLTDVVEYGANGNETLLVKGATYSLSGLTSGATALQASAVASGVLTLPAATDTLAVLGTFAAPPAIGNTTPAAGAFTTLSATGVMTFKSAQADQSKVDVAPTTGFSQTIANGCSTLLLKPAGTLATGTVVMAAAPVDGQLACVMSSQTITALTVSPNAGQSISGAPSTIGASTPFTMIYDLASTTWYRMH